MKKFLYSSFAILLSVNFTFAQNCAGNRYLLPIFSNVTAVKDIKYGKNFQQDGTTEQELFLDVYTPNGDTETERPVILFAHGGSFIGGSKDQVASQCSSFAKLGYTAISMQYRLLNPLSPEVMADPSTAFLKEVLRAVHDMRAAIRFIRKSYYEGGNPYGVNPNIIIVGGVSAGGLLAAHTAYLNKDSEIPAAIQQYAIDQGGIEGNSGNPGYSSVPQIVLSFCGGIGDTSWIEAGDQPVFGIHTDDDTTVPNLSGYPNVSGFQIQVMIHGDSLISIRAENIGINHFYKGYPTGGHCGYDANEAAAYVTEFLHNQLCILGGISTQEFAHQIAVNIYPNPTSEIINIDFSDVNSQSTVQIINTVGQIITSHTIPADQPHTQIALNGLANGIYMVKIINAEGKTTTKKIIVQ